MKKFLVITFVFLFLSFSSLAKEGSDPFAFGDVEIDEQVATDNANSPANGQEASSGDESVEQGVRPQIQTAPFVPMEVPKKNKKEDNEKNTIDPNQSLADTFQEEKKDSLLPIKVEGTWVDKLKLTNPLQSIKDATSSGKVGEDEDISLEGMVSSSQRVKRRSNASVFDISGLMLRMKVEQVEETMQNRGFRKIYQKMEIPNFIRWRNEEKCRLDGVVGYERLDACVIDRAKKDNHQYVDTIKFSKFDSQEDIEVRFTSNFTENKVYQITYKSLTPRIVGNSPKAIYLRNIKIYDFWKKISQKYGDPDNKDDILWGLGGNKPFLKANTGYLRLEDPMFRELDYTRMSREDQRFINSDFYNF